MAHLTPEEQRRRDSEWIRLYGERAYADAIAATEWVLSLPYPPPPRPAAPAGDQWGAQEPVRRSSGGHVTFAQPEPLVVQAAWGHPRIWPAHVIDAPNFVRMMALRGRAALRRAVPTQLTTR